jgi:2,3-bisphosphoglycerate-independent phosphoglycerate mutase
MGSDIPMVIGEIGFKCNFAYMNETNNIVEKRRVDREFPKWGLPLIDSLNGNIIEGFPDYK